MTAPELNIDVNSPVWEGLFVQIQDLGYTKAIIIGNFNINLLHINICNKEHYGDFLDLMLGYNLIPKSMLPTRMTEDSCSLIDNRAGHTLGVKSVARGWKMKIVIVIFFFFLTWSVAVT